MTAGAFPGGSSISRGHIAARRPLDSRPNDVEADAEGAPGGARTRIRRVLAELEQGTAGSAWRSSAPGCHGCRGRGKDAVQDGDRDRRVGDRCACRVAVVQQPGQDARRQPRIAHRGAADVSLRVVHPGAGTGPHLSIDGFLGFRP
jgi:hypothetical protein